MDKYIDRQHAGKILSTHLKKYANKEDVIVLALPRGGVPVAYEIAKSLSVPLDVFIVRKLGVPGHKELAMGALASGGVILLNDELIGYLHISKSSIDEVIKSEEKELSRRESLYHVNEEVPVLKDKTILLVDDGIATGSTMHAAIMALRQQKPAQIIVAVPVAAQDTYHEMTKLVDKIICPLTPVNFYAVGLWYQNFSQTSDSEVCELLKRARQEKRSAN
ncbi:phosphoribosyltransferase [Legionella maioricensis]|uniref:Phosphoribosyltransferase n=1 Tax=Legionella maioricensis TaxID=2896528 RepID=A0A9X2D266_9GAMM|nr:phosphoribosyltransferase [Legionella maioricensis]MCL9684959.1 phosphoribosyltransferase [Legionella maioricensis]MCL9688209.1 phosphoribosyltransferase [Legionella maioricensis]